MGRAKLDMKLIANLKRRKETYQKRKIGLKKKLHEFTVLCNVPACMILYGPSQGDRPVKVETWPPELDEVNNIIERYRQVPEENKQKRRQDLYDFFQERKKKAEADLGKLRKEHDEFQYFDEQFKGLSVEQLQQVLQRLGSKMESVDERIKHKKNQDMKGMSDQSNVAPFSMPNTSYEGNMFSNNIQQQLDGSLYRPFFGGQGVSTDHHSQYKKIKTNDYQPCDNNSFMLNSAYMYANIPYDPPMLSRGNTDFGYPVSSTFNVMPTSTLMPIPWSGSMHSAGYPSHYYQPPMHHGSSSSQGPQRLFTMNSFPMSSGSTLRQMSYPPEESFGIQDQPNRYRQQ
ncbi:floral homeotic protein DEFICIENS-like [Papaver somniferum]|uniref:floral homeotic protein DEFICIENS-like n=1 Tax=Papaver somniferum TaxID=3469 RepID=UPI000E7033DC|nr:floral homeotic protein DEFICIENS-like [Papaver somniferum]